MRVVKKPEERRAEMVAAASKLFANQGFVRTSVAEIVSAVDVAKGTAGVVKAGADLVAVVAPMKAVKNLPKVGKVVAKAKPGADVSNKIGK